MVTHCILFWGKDVIKAYKSTRQGKSEDRHHQYMADHYKETPAWWYGVVLLISFIFGLVVVLKENITLPVWAYIVSLLLGMAFGPFVSQDYLSGVYLLTSLCRALFCMLDLETVSLQTICQSWWLVSWSLDAPLAICTLLLGPTTL